MMKKGFTLVELMVTVVVIAIVSSALLLSWTPAQKAFNLRHAAFQLADDLRRTQQLSLSTHTFDCDPLPAEDYTGFGLYLNTSSSTTAYQIFENCSSDNRVWDSGEEKETLNFAQDIEIQSLEKTGVSVSSLSVFFVPPNPDTYINEEVAGEEAKITLTNGSSTAVVKINSSGCIEVD